MDIATAPITACPSCGAVAAIDLPGRRALIVTAHWALGPRVIVECVVCGGATVQPDGSLTRRGLWLPEPALVDDLLHRAYPEVPAATKLWLAREDRRIGPDQGRGAV